MIDYSCNYTSWESNAPMSGVKFRRFGPIEGPLQWIMIYSTLQGDFIRARDRKRTTTGGNDGDAARKVMCDNKQACNVEY